MKHLRDLGRRKVRTSLTILGITIGIWSLVVFGSMANKINALVEGGSSYYNGKVTLTDKGAGAFGIAPISLTTVEAVGSVPGVAAVAPSITILRDPDTSASFGIPKMIDGSIPGADKGLETFSTRIATGRGLEAGDAGAKVAVLGADVAREESRKVGDTIDLRGTTFTVIGTLEPTLTAPDSTVMIPLAAAQELLLASLPPLVRDSLDASDLATSLAVYPAAGTDVEQLASALEAAVPSVSAMTGADFDQQVGSSTAIFNAILVGIGLISLIVGGLSVINTMAMAISERTREIGIKRAIGGSQFRLVREFVVEASLIGIIGGLIGLGLGAVVVTIANEAGRASGTVLFDLTASTALTALLFSTALGAIAGFVPALHAARLDPVSALRYE